MVHVSMANYYSIVTDRSFSSETKAEPDYPAEWQRNCYLL